MRPVVKLEAKVIQTREIPAGAGIGYGHAAKAVEPMRPCHDLARLCRRLAPPRRLIRLLCRQKTSLRRPRVDGFNHPRYFRSSARNARTRVLVELIGPHQSVDEVAAQAGTIGYEVLTSLRHRFHRVYVDG